MRRLIITLTGILLASGIARAESESSWEGKIRAGGVMIDEEGDVSTMQETFNLYEGFSLSSIYLKGRFDPRTHLLLDLTDVNRDDRRGRLDFRKTGLLHFQSRYDENRFIFDPDGRVDSRRRDSWSSLSFTPNRSVWLSADYGLETRSGDRLGYTGAPEGWLGTSYDSKQHRWRVEAQGHTNSGIGATAAYDGVKQTDAIDPLRERKGYVVSANLHLPGVYFDRVTHVVRGSIGKSELPESDVSYDLKTIQYTGIVDAARWARLKYRFYGGRVDDDATRMRTDNFMHDVDATLRWRVALLTLGYGWESRDDDRVITTTNTVRGSLSLTEPRNRISGRVSYAVRNTDDQEAATLLKDTEYDRLEARVDGRPVDALSLGARVADRTRKMADIGSEADGLVTTVYGTWHQEAPDSGWMPAADLGVDYTYSDDDYDNVYGSEHILTHAVTGRVGLVALDRVDLKAAVTWLKLEKDLDIEKSILSFGAGYRFAKGFGADVQYNIYNYDDALILDRYYTANVVWVNVAYSFATE